MIFFKKFLNKIFFKRQIDLFPRQIKKKNQLWYLPAGEDTIAAINQLSAVVKDNPDAIEIYLALGNLFRAQSELERAILIRQSIIARPNLQPAFKARAWYELGIDYKRAGLVDRAIYALKQAEKIAGKNKEILEILAKIYAQSGDFKQAAYYYNQLNNNIAYAHYLIKWARHNKQNNREKLKLIKKALEAYIGSPEAWLELLLIYWQTKQIKDFKSNLKKALSSVHSSINFTILEGIYQQFKDNTKEDISPFVEIIHDIITNVITTINKDILLTYYNARFLLLIDEKEKSRIWLDKTLLLDSEFWPARLILLQLDMDKQALSQNFKTHLNFFISKAFKVKHFICKRCGLKRENLFFLCPRCASWHSITFRKNLNE
ncbi:Lipopolysaccharide biosynthesis regulator YciM, contains six TPR domains and a predicted metal-binding C-terminal domain [Desulfonauticus submarinus]|uniref:Lipopolysaccharide biosynthesis regulator YciM, contains six TPR domains and a predicted metal-binding C-terminal domain n=1 Tax=Desulfonauticus submarinus TaxID=206665 RepID=A0A1H0A2F4_9BACT|nr:tetratricopeptide repeat protein [Desulfonauticus submarinus]SDN27143.1 Lipopolysaccharide biosynthesis regulator YciM, contains six TPR domains and a predicted metal-binding C-terminal domain [Desulfonauticus submarinus]